MKEFDESEALDFIRANAGSERVSAYSDDDLLNIVDMIWDYYEINGMLDIDADADDEEDSLPEDITVYVKRMLKKDAVAKVSADDVYDIVRAELSYEASLDS